MDQLFALLYICKLFGRLGVDVKGTLRDYSRREGVSL